MSTRVELDAVARLYRHRFSDEDRETKTRVWEVLVREFFQRWIRPQDTVLDLGCGHGDFLNHVRCGRRIGVDFNTENREWLVPGVEFHAAATDDLEFLTDSSVDVVFTSNVLEHLANKTAVERTLDEVRRVLRPGGTVLVMGPNLRYVQGSYWDFWDHQVPMTDRSLVELLATLGFKVTHQYPRFLPYTTRSALPKSPVLVHWYLKLPLAWRVFGGQFFLRAIAAGGCSQADAPCGDGLVSIVLPVYNEADNIQACLRGLSAGLADLSHEILVCYDFEGDTTLPAIATMPDRPVEVRLVRNTLGRGVAYALQAGFMAARGDVVVTTMADLSDPPEVIPQMVSKIRNQGAAVVSGSRYMSGGEQVGGPLLKRTLSRLAGLSLHYLAGLGTRDPTTNFRAYSADFLEAVTVQSRRGFEVALELTTKAHLMGYQVAEVASRWTERSAGTSRFQLLRWLPGYLRWYTAALAAPAVVWLTWLAMTAWAGWFIATYGPNLPYWDEWENFPFLEGQPITLEWLWSPHNEHRIPLGRIAYLLAARLSGLDTRGPMVANAVILSLLGALGIIAARRIHKRTRLTDALIPLSVIGFVNYATLLEGFQLQFVLTTALFCVLVSVVALSKDWFKLPSLAILGASLLGLPLTGGAGLALALPITMLLACGALVGLRSLDSQVRSSARRALALSGTSALLLILYQWNMRQPAPVPVGDTIVGALQFLSTALSPDHPTYWAVLSTIVGLIVAGTVTLLGWRIAAMESTRVRDLGLLTCLAATGVLALAIGVDRGFGLAARYATLAVGLVFLAYLAVSASSGLLAAAIRWTLLLALLTAVPINIAKGSTYGTDRRAGFLGLQADIRSGTSVDILSTKYLDDVDPSTTSADAIRNMRDHRIGPFANNDLVLNGSAPVVEEESLSTEPSSTYGLTRTGEWWQPTGPFTSLVFELPRQQNVTGVRFEFNQQSSPGALLTMRAYWSSTESFPCGANTLVGASLIGWRQQCLLLFYLASSDGEQRPTFWIVSPVTRLRFDMGAKPFKVNKLVLLHAQSD